MINESGLKPLGRAVLVKHYEPERASSLIVMPDNVEANQLMVEQRAIVVAVGATCWHDEPAARAQVGDKVLISRFSGYMAKGTKDGKQYRFVNDRDIFAAIDQE